MAEHDQAREAIEILSNEKPGALVQAPVQQHETAGMVLAAQAKALVEARFTVAHMKPRDLDVVREKLLRECRRPAFSKGAIYKKPIGKGIEGPSIRLAEAAIQAMGNIVTEAPTIYDDDDKRIMRVSASDMESNVVYSQDVTVMKRVERRSLRDGDVPIRKRTNAQGQTVFLLQATDDEILNTQGALVSKAVRTVALRLVPDWLIDEALDVCRETRAKAMAEDPDAQKRRLFDAFGRVGVRLEEIKSYLGHDGERLSPKEREDLAGIFQAIRDGDTTWREVMDAKDPKEKEQGKEGEKPAGGAPRGAAAVREQIRRGAGEDPAP